MRVIDHHPSQIVQPDRRRTASARLAVTVCGVLAGACNHREMPRLPGLAAEPPQSPLTYDVFCDTTPGSHCDRPAVDRTLRAVIIRTVLRPESRVRFWRLDGSGEETEKVGEFIVPPRAANHAARHRTRERWRLEMAAALAPAVEQLFATTPPRRSPIADALSRIAATTTPGSRRIIILITDGRENATARLECGVLPNERVWLRALDRDDLLPTGSLTNIRVEFAQFRAGRIPGRGCRSSTGRERALAGLWHAALVHAGAREVRIDPGDPSVVAEVDTTTNNEEAQ